MYRQKLQEDLCAVSSGGVRTAQTMTCKLVDEVPPTQSPFMVYSTRKPKSHPFFEERFDEMLRKQGRNEFT